MTFLTFPDKGEKALFKSYFPSAYNCWSASAWAFCRTLIANLGVCCGNLLALNTKSRKKKSHQTLRSTPNSYHFILEKNWSRWLLLKLFFCQLLNRIRMRVIAQARNHSWFVKEITVSRSQIPFDQAILQRAEGKKSLPKNRVLQYSRSKRFLLRKRFAFQVSRNFCFSQSCFGSETLAAGEPSLFTSHFSPQARR